MGIIKKNKKGVSVAELIAAIMIIGLASTSITTMIITSQKGQIRAQEYLLASEMAKTYDAILSKDIKKAKLGDNTITWPDKATKSYVIVGGYDATETTGYNSGTILNTITGGSGSSDIYRYLYSEAPEDHFTLNSKTFDKTNVKIEVYMISTRFGYYKTRITVKYSNDREVTYDGTHFSD